MKIDFSVVIPVYNTPEKYLESCISHIRSNKSCSFEILLVDDGSGEETAGCLERLADGDPGVRLLRQEHGGVSCARNYGTRMAAGEYVTYVDADDLLVPGILDRLLPVLREYEPDLLIAQIARELKKSDGGGIETGGGELAEELRRYYLTMEHPRWKSPERWINRAPHGRFVRREIACKTAYREDIAVGEDVLWNFDLLRAVDRILLYLHQGYCYRELAFSATQRYRPDFPREVRRLLSLYRRELKDEPAELRRCYYAAAVEYFTIMMRVYVFGQNDGESRRRYESEIASGFWKNIFRRVSPALLSGRYRLTAVLAKAGCYRLIYIMFQIHHRRRA